MPARIYRNVLRLCSRAKKCRGVSLRQRLTPLHTPAGILELALLGGPVPSFEGQH
jgi:hypothetical protein